MRKMKRMVSRIVLGMVLLLMCTVTSPAPNPGFTECSPSGYNCNILITLGKNGSLTVTSNPNMPYYPTPAGWTDIGSLIGFKNSSNSAVYSIGLNATPGDPYEAAWICGRPNSTANYNAPNVQIINIPRTSNFANPPYYFYNSCPNCTPPWETSCDVTFSGGVPRNGTTYFSIHNLSPNYTGYFQVHTNSVVPWLSFSDAIVQDQTVNATLTLFPPNSATVTLNLATIAGMASAVFAANNSTTLTLTTAGPVQIPIKGVTADNSNNPNMQLSASVSGTQRSLNFGVINPQVIIQLESGKIWPGTSGFVVFSSTQNMTTAATAVGQPSGGSYQWSLGSLLAFNGSSTTANTAVKGTSASASPEDTYLQVTYTINGISTSASVRFTVRQSSFLNNFGLTGGPDRTVPVSQQGGSVTGYITNITYFVEDQFGTAQSPSLLQVSGMDVTELLLVIQQSDPSVVLDPPEGVPRTAQTIAQGSVDDHLSVTAVGGVPNGYSDMIDQQFTVTGFTFGQHQIQRHLQTYATVDLARVAMTP